jgi:hypothetical protein
MYCTTQTADGNLIEQQRWPAYLQATKQQHTPGTAQVHLQLNPAALQKPQPPPLLSRLTLRCRRSVRQQLHEDRPTGQPKWPTWSQTPGSSAAVATAEEYSAARRLGLAQQL